MIEKANREKAAGAVLAELSELAYFTACQAERQAIEAELPGAHQALRMAEQRQEQAHQALVMADRERRKVQAERVLSEDEQESAALDIKIGEMDRNYQRFEAENRTAHNLVLSVSGELERLETRLAALVARQKPEAPMLRAALDLLS